MTEGLSSNVIHDSVIEITLKPVEDNESTWSLMKASRGETTTATNLTEGSELSL